MKKLLLIFACSGTILASAQNNVNITQQQYGALKQNGQLDLTKKYQFIGSSLLDKKVKPTTEVLAQRGQRAMCSCLIPLDSSFSLVPFYSDDSVEFRNDDSYTDKLALPFTFNFFGTNYDSLYINNNGNISFSAPYYEYTPDSFPTSLFQMIAPFWGDVDTRDPFSGLVYYKMTSTALIIKWENVGYYNVHSDLMNTFQLIITDGTDTLLPAGNNVAFCYGDMGWTTGDASSGVAGFGGVPATVGVNQGNGADYFQVGRFDQPGNTFDGPYNMADQVDFLDNQEMYFNVGMSGNIPPLVINNNICDTIDVYTGDTLRSGEVGSATFNIAATTPEINQLVNVTVSSSSPANFTYVNVKNTPTYKEYECTFTTDNLASGIYTVDVVATDNGVPSQVTSKTVVIKVVNGLATGIKEQSKSDISLYPNPTDGFINVKHNFNTSANPVLTLVNVLGDTVSTVHLNNQTQGVDMSALPKGVYFATITSKEGKSKSFKVVHK
jgi:hypothetical protein